MVTHSHKGDTAITLYVIVYHLYYEMHLEFNELTTYLDSLLISDFVPQVNPETNVNNW